MMAELSFRFKVRTNPEKQVPFTTSYTPVSKTDEFLRSKAKDPHHPILLKKIDEKHTRGENFQVGSLHSSGGSTIVSSMIGRGQAAYSPREEQISYRPSDERDLSNFDISMDSIASQDNLQVQENVPFGGNENVGYDLYELDDRIYGTFDPSPMSIGETPRVFQSAASEFSPSRDSASHHSQDSSTPFSKLEDNSN